MSITRPKASLLPTLIIAIGWLFSCSSIQAAAPIKTQGKTQGQILGKTTRIQNIQTLLAEQRYSGALDEILKQLQPLNPKDQKYQQLVQLQAVALAGQGRYKTAGKLFQQLIQQSQAIPATYLNLARLQLTQNQLQQAEHTLRQGLKRYPNNSLLHARHVQLLLLKTRTAIDQARQHHPQDIELLRSRNVISGLLLPRKHSSEPSTTANNKRCYRLGPYRDTNNLQTQQARLKQSYPQAQFNITQATQGQLQQLLAIGFSTRQQAQLALKALKQSGLRDISLTGHTDYGPALSLGVFRLSESLQRRKTQVANANLQLVDITLGQKAGQYLQFQISQQSQPPENAKPESCPQ